MEFGDRVRGARRAKGITQAQLAKEIGLSTRSVQAYELNRSAPRSYALYLKLARALDLSAEYLAGISDEDAPRQAGSYGNEFVRSGAERDAPREAGSRGNGFIRPDAGRDAPREAAAQYGNYGTVRAASILEQAAALFESGELSGDDKLDFMREINEIFLESKARTRK